MVVARWVEGQGRGVVVSVYRVSDLQDEKILEIC